MTRPLCCFAAIVALLLAAPVARATEYFYEDFENGVTGWSVLNPNSEVFAWHFQGGAWGNQCNAKAMAGYTDPWSEPTNDPYLRPFIKAEHAASGPTELGGIVWFSVDFRHLGGYPDPNTSTGWKTSTVYFLDANDNGMGFQWGGQKRLDPDDPMDISVRIRHGAERWGIMGLNMASGILNTDNYVAHRFEVMIDWDNNLVDEYHDGELVISATIGFDYEEDKTFNRVIVDFHNQYKDSPWIDNIYCGDVRNPHTDPAIVAGDANSDLKVDILDLTDLAGNWAQGVNRTWTQGDFNFDHTVDILDLTDMAGNWGYDGTGGAAVPEPATMTLLGLAGVALLRRRQ
jgi:hypothetical protein